MDGLRGLAVTSVVAFHYALLGPPPVDHPIGAQQVYPWLQRLTALGWSGVDLFFVLSGFLIGGILLDAKESPSYYKTFYLRRFYRILPLYFLWISGYILVMFALRDALMYYLRAPVDRVPDTGVFLLFAFLQYVTYAGYNTLGWAWLSPTWSLAVEEQFYVVAPLLIRRLTRRAIFVVMCSVVLLAPFLRMWVHFHLPTNSVGLDLAYTLMPCRADSLAIGVLVALLRRDERFRKWLPQRTQALYVLMAVFLIGAIALGVWSPNAFTIPMESVGYSWLAVLYALILLLVLEKPLGPIASLCRTGWLCELGRISYCVYLVHGATVWTSQTIMRCIVAQPSVWEYAASSCVAALAVYAFARASWRDIESPLLRRAHAFQY